MTKLTPDEILDRIVRLLNWTFGSSLGPADSAMINSSIARNWSVRNKWSVTTDKTGQALIAYLLMLNDIVDNIDSHIAGGGNSKEKQRNRLRRDIFDYFKGDFKVRKTGAYGRIMNMIHLVVEQARPGCTGVTPPDPPRAKPVPPSAPAPTLAPAPTPAPSSMPPPATAQPAGGFWNFMQNMMGPGMHPAGAPPGVGFGNPNYRFDPQALMAQERNNAAMTQLWSNIEKMRHDTNMHVIGNTR
jgi:hypothetical protein